MNIFKEILPFELVVVIIAILYIIPTFFVSRKYPEDFYAGYLFASMPVVVFYFNPYAKFYLFLSIAALVIGGMVIFNRIKNRLGQLWGLVWNAIFVAMYVLFFEKVDTFSNMEYFAYFAIIAGSIILASALYYIRVVRKKRILNS